MEATNEINTNVLVSKESTKTTKVKTEKKESTSKAKKENATIKANEHILNNMSVSDAFSNIDKSIFINCKGQNKEFIYKSQFTKDLKTDRETKKFREKMRDILESYVLAFDKYTKANDKKLLKQTLESFNNTFYKVFYIKNDFTLESLCSNNTSDKKKDSIKTMLVQIKSIK